jgi:hypothetical protein
VVSALERCLARIGNVKSASRLLSGISGLRVVDRPTGNCTPATWNPPGEGSHGVARVLWWGYLAAAFNPACSASAAALSVASQVNSGSLRPKWP